MVVVNSKGDEGPLSEPFWRLETLNEAKVVEVALKRRFPQVYPILAESLEAADPYDIVYPENANEYSDVVQEILVLLAWVNGDIGKLTERQVDEVVREALARRFGEKPDEMRVRKAVELIWQKFFSP